MGEKKEGDLYHNFSRKDLQGFCKKYGLPAKRSNSEMATSLILYLEKRNIGSENVREAFGSDPYLSLWSERQPGVRMDPAFNKRTDLREMSSHNGFGHFRKHQVPDENVSQSCRVPACSDKASGDMDPLTEPHRGSNSGAGDAENAFSSVLSSTTKTSHSFEYDVSCGDGIQLYVDLNSTTSDWIESLEASVRTSHDIYNHLSNERKGSFLMDSHNNNQLEDESSPTIRNTVHNLEDLCEEQGNVSSITKPITTLQNCGSECLIRKENVVGTNFDASLVTQIRTYKQTCSPPDPVLKNTGLYGSLFMGIEASPSVNSLQRHDIVTTSFSMVDTCLVSADQPQISRTLNFGPFSSRQLCGDVPQMWPGQIIDQRHYTSSYIMSGLSNVGPRLGIDHGKASISSKGNRRIPKARTLLGRSSEEPRPYFPFQRLSPTCVNLGTSITTVNGGFIGSREAGQEAVELPRKEVSRCPFNVGGPLDLALAKKNRADQDVFNDSNNLDEDICRSNLDNSKASDGNTSLEFNNFRQSMKAPWVNPANSQCNELKRHFSSVDDQRQHGSLEANIFRASTEFYGDARASRKRSMRPVSKWIVQDKSGDAHDKL